MITKLLKNTNIRIAYVTKNAMQNHFKPNKLVKFWAMGIWGSVMDRD
jgi:hypothetical protein